MFDLLERPRCSSSPPAMPWVLVALLGFGLDSGIEALATKLRSLIGWVPQPSLDHILEDTIAEAVLEKAAVSVGAG